MVKEYLPHFLLDVRDGHRREADGDANEDSPEVEGEDGLELPGQSWLLRREHVGTGLVTRLNTINKNIYS